MRSRPLLRLECTDYLGDGCDSLLEARSVEPIFTHDNVKKKHAKLDEVINPSPQWSNEYNHPIPNEINQTQHWSPCNQVMQPVQYQALDPLPSTGTSGGMTPMPQQNYQTQYPNWPPVQQNLIRPMFTPHQQNIPSVGLPNHQFVQQSQYYGNVGNSAYHSQNSQWNMAMNQYQYGGVKNNPIVHQGVNGHPVEPQTSPVMHIKITQVPKPKVKKIGKKKRHRTAFTTDQVLALEKVFKTQSYVSRDERAVIHKKLGISDRAIKVWFQNRRMKGKRELMEEESDDSSDVSEFSLNQSPDIPVPCQQMEPVSSTSHDVDVIEKKIKMNVVDANGIVRFEDEVWDNIVNALTARVPPNVQVSEVVKNEVHLSPETSNTSGSMMYDPISPPDTGSTLENDDEGLQWIPPSDTEQMQKLFDDHFC